jgi:Uma2 family endonuclease
MGTALLVSLEEFLADPEIDERRLELIDGEVYEKPMPTWGHGTLAMDLGFALRDHGFVAAEPRAVIGQVGSFDASSPIPDVAFYRENPPPPNEWMRRPPTVAAEILSPGQSRRDMRPKVALYLAFGVESVWVVDPAGRAIEVYEGDGRRVLEEGQTLTTEAIPGFELGVAKLFERVPREG